MNHDASDRLRRPGLLARLQGLRDAGSGPADPVGRALWGAPGLAEPPLRMPPGVTVERDLAYGDPAVEAHPAQRLDVYRPATGGSGDALVLVHGGGWRRGDKGQARLLQHKLAHWCTRGWVLASVNYRLLPEAGPLEQASDVARALAYVQAEAGRWGVDAARCVLMGHSAGAHLVALLAADADLAQRHAALPWRATVAIDTTAYDVVALMQAPHLGLFDLAFGDDPQAWRAVSPCHRLMDHASPPSAPMLLVCAAERAASCAAARALAHRVLALGGRATVLPVALDHLEINRQLGLDAHYTAAVDAFLEST